MAESVLPSYMLSTGTQPILFILCESLHKGMVLILEVSDVKMLPFEMSKLERLAMMEICS